MAENDNDIIVSPQDKFVITREKVVEMLYQDRELAHKSGKVNAAISAAKLLGDSIGMFKVNESNNTVVNNYIRPFTEIDRMALEALSRDHKSSRVKHESD